MERIGDITRSNIIGLSNTETGKIRLFRNGGQNATNRLFSCLQNGVEERYVFVLLNLVSHVNSRSLSPPSGFASETKAKLHEVKLKALL